MSVGQQESKRKSLALGICLASTALAMTAWRFGGRPWLVLAFLASVWDTTAAWLGGRLLLLNKSVGQLFRTARDSGGSVFRLSPVAKTISRGAMILMVASVATCSFGP